MRLVLITPTKVVVYENRVPLAAYDVVDALDKKEIEYVRTMEYKTKA